MPRRNKMGVKLPTGCEGFVDRHGRPRFYYRNREAGIRVPLPGLPGSPDFITAYSEAQGSYRKPAGLRVVLPSSVDAHVQRYLESDSAFAFKAQSESTQNLRRGLIERFRVKNATLKTRALLGRHLQAYLADLTPSAQRNHKKALAHFFKFCLTENLISADPTADVVQKKMAPTGGFKTWTEAAVDTYREKYKLGTKARLAMELMLNLGVRVSDAWQLGPRHFRDGILTDYQPHKGRNTGGHLINVPVHADLQKAIDAHKVAPGQTTFLVNEWGNPYTAQYLGTSIKGWCADAGAGDFGSHGLRKLCLVRLAEAGCSPFEIMSISGHKDLKEVQTYTEAANRKKLALIAVARVSGIELNAALPLDKLREAYKAATKAPVPVLEAAE